MKNLAEFQIIGRVGRVTPLDGAMRVSVCANYRRQDGDNWVDDPHWNEVIIFNRKTREYVGNHVAKGDLVHARGRLRQNCFTDRETGEERYTVDMIALDFGCLAKTQANDAS
ncbi:single-stranded DNA-binding protein [Aureimonas altamirensis]|uniref:single-stranded DNA-binding protein n=1 Tax=Aureimonas altamirensis TaxID=370622 RepID=UPI002554B685|nr:single-stranded DNA-binding protein [Aureimonas altamirensis]